MIPEIVPSVNTLPIMESLGIHLESMIAIQATAYPSHWSEADRRELAERHLFRSCDEYQPNIEGRS